MCLPISIAFGWFYFLVTILPQTFGSVYKFPTGSIGLCYLAGGLGNTSGSIFAGAISDKLYHKAVAKNNGEIVKEFRLRPIYIGVPLIALGAVMYGWFLHVPTHFMGPLASYTIGKLLMFCMARSAPFFFNSLLYIWQLHLASCSQLRWQTRIS